MVESKAAQELQAVARDMQMRRRYPSAVVTVILVAAVGCGSTDSSTRSATTGAETTALPKPQPKPVRPTMRDYRQRGPYAFASPPLLISEGPITDPAKFDSKDPTVFFRLRPYPRNVRHLRVSLVKGQVVSPAVGGGQEPPLDGKDFAGCYSYSMGWPPPGANGTPRAREGEYLTVEVLVIDYDARNHQRIRGRIAARVPMQHGLESPPDDTTGRAAYRKLIGCA